MFAVITVIGFYEIRYTTDSSYNTSATVQYIKLLGHKMLQTVLVGNEEIW